jgi:iron(III) transport system substrate-binding protein
VYSVRGEQIVGQVIERFQRETGVGVEFCYGSPAELGRAILAGGANAPADVYLGPNVVGLIGSGRLRALPDRILTRVDEQFRSTGGQWVGVTGRARVVVYNPDRVSADELPASILGFTDPAWAGRLGWAPTNGSFIDFVAALRVIQGDEGARDWLAGVQANRPIVYDAPPGGENGSIVDAVAAGVVDVGFVNSYYLPELRPMGSRPEKVAGTYYTDGDPGAIVHVSIGAGIVGTARNVPAAERLIEFLLANESQRAFAQVFELPLANGVVDPSDEPLFDLVSLRQPALNLNRLEEAMPGGRALIAEVTAAGAR